MNLGGAWGSAPHQILDTDDPGAPVLAQFTNHPTSVIGGGQIGYNWQFPGWGWGNGVVAGIEADIQGASKSRSKCLNFVEGLAAGEVEPPGGGNEGGNGNGCGCPGGNGNGNGNGNGCGEDCQGDCGPNCQGQDNSWFGTMRGRAGVAFDRVLPYVTGWMGVRPSPDQCYLRGDRDHIQHLKDFERLDGRRWCRMGVLGSLDRQVRVSLHRPRQTK